MDCKLCESGHNFLSALSLTLLALLTILICLTCFSVSIFVTRVGFLLFAFTISRSLRLRGCARFCASGPFLILLDDLASFFECALRGTATDSRRDRE
jgi:hypothetical protein